MPKTATVVCADLYGNEHEVAVGQLRWRPSVYGIVVQDNKILLSRQAGAHTIPGGGVELGEMPEEALIREIKEETGINVCNPRLELCKSTFFKLPRSTKGVHTQSILLFYRCDVVDGELSTAFMTPEELELGGEMPEWVPLDQLGKLRVIGSTHWLPVVEKIIEKNQQ